MGENHPDVAKSLNNLAGLYQDQGQYAQAEPLYQCALAIWEKALGAYHPNVVLSLENLVGLYQQTNVVLSLENLVGLYQQTDCAALAGPLEKRAAAIRAIKR
nr:tetratricopeptide repeat protein [Thiothrix caldifontis]